MTKPILKTKPAAAKKPDNYIHIIHELDKTIESLRKIWLKAKGEVRQVLRAGLDGLLDERLRLMKLRDKK